MRKDLQIPWILILPAGLAGAVAALSMRYGPGIGGDATIYITSARNLLAGHGLGLVGADGAFRLIPYFPPFYSLVLAACGVFGSDLVSVAYWLNVLLFGATTWVCGWMLSRFITSRMYAVLLALMIAVSPVLVPVYSWAMSEPLAVFLGFGGMGILLIYLEQPAKKWQFVISAVMVGLSFLTRYNSVAYVLAGVGGTYVLLSGKKDTDGLTNRSKRRYSGPFFQAMLYGVIACLPMLAWLIYDFSHTAGLSSRSMLNGAQMAARLGSFWKPFGQVLLFWLLPDSWADDPPYPALLNRLLLPGILLGLLVWAGLIWRKNRQHVLPPGLMHLGLLVGLFTLAYFCVNLLVYLTTYPPITIGSRMYAPMHLGMLCLLVGLVCASACVWPGSRWLQWLLPLGLMLLLGWYGWRSARIVSQNYNEGMGYLSPQWQNSNLVAVVRDLPAEAQIVTNEEMALLFLTGRSTYPLAEIYQDIPSADFYRYGDGHLTGDKAQTAFREHGAALVLFDSLEAQISGLYGERTSERITALTHGLRQAFRGEDGAIYYWP